MTRKGKEAGKEHLGTLSGWLSYLDPMTSNEIHYGMKEAGQVGRKREETEDCIFFASIWLLDVLFSPKLFPSSELFPTVPLTYFALFTLIWRGEGGGRLKSKTCNTCCWRGGKTWKEMEFTGFSCLHRPLVHVNNIPCHPTFSLIFLLVLCQRLGFLQPSL